MDEVRLKVFTYDPDSGQPPTYLTRSVPYYRGITALQALHKLNETAEYVAYRHCCRQASCGVCTVQVNHRHTLACTYVIKNPGGEIVIEPRKGQRVLRDLITAQGEE